MVSIKGDLKPFRITGEDMINLLTQLTDKVTSKRIELEVGRFSSTSSTIQGIKKFLRDVRLPSVASDVSVLIYGKPQVYIFFDKGYASYIISGASNIDEARQTEDLVVSFFEKHKTFRFLSMFPALAIGCILFFIAGLELGFYIDHLTSGRILSYPFLHFFVGLACSTFLVYMLWSVLTRETPSFSFVHAVMLIEEKKSSVLWALLSTIILESVVAIVVTLITR